MNRASKIVLGILTFLPLLVFVLMGGYVIYQMVSLMAAQDPYMPMLLFSYLGYALPFFFIFGLFNLGLVIFYLIRIGQNPRLDTEKKFLWIVVVITINMLSMPIYWYVHIWQEKPQNPELNPAFNQAYESTGTEPPEF